MHFFIYQACVVLTYFLLELYISSCKLDLFHITIFNQQDLIIGRPEAVYFYEVDGMGPCWAFFFMVLAGHLMVIKSL